jgi:hypothetical protein
MSLGQSGAGGIGPPSISGIGLWASPGVLASGAGGIGSLLEPPSVAGGTAPEPPEPEPPELPASTVEVPPDPLLLEPMTLQVISQVCQEAQAGAAGLQTDAVGTHIQPKH